MSIKNVIPKQADEALKSTKKMPVWLLVFVVVGAILSFGLMKWIDYLELDGIYRLSGWLLFVVIALVVSFVSIWKLFSTKNWERAQGRIISSGIEEMRNMHRAGNAPGTERYEYKANVRYEYQLCGQKFVSDRLFPGFLPSIYRRRTDAENAIRDFSPGKEVSVYYNPKKPAQSSLFSGSIIPLKGYIFLVVFISFTALIIISAIVLLGN